MSDTFCILPWHQSTVWIDGTVRLCCRASRPIPDASGRPLSLEETPFQDIWNSPHLVEVRRAMVEGRRVADCENCYAHEATMGTSKRTESNDVWLANSVSDCDAATAISRIKERSESIGHVLRRSPFALHLWLGNVCNLRCRMCNPLFSSRIAQDPVHASWTAERAAVPSAQPRFDDARTWFDSPTVVLDDLFREPNQIDDLAFAGGEPLLLKQIVPLLQTLIDRGRAPHMRLYFSTNGTMFSPALVEVMRPFQRVTLAVSFDGVGPLNDYIRNGVSWPRLVDNLHRMRELTWLKLAAEPTFQACNALHIADVLRFCDSVGLTCGLSNILQWPRHLSFDVLPRAVRDEAARRLEAYTAAGGAADRTGVDALVRALRGPAASDQPQLLGHFMRFTNALDASRGERLAHVAPELVEALAAAGFPWDDAIGTPSPVPTGAAVPIAR